MKIEELKKKIDALYTATRLKGDFSSSIDEVNELIKYANLFSLDEDVLGLRRTKADLYRRLGETHKALEEYHYLYELVVAKSDLNSQVGILNTTSHIQMELGLYKEAIKGFKEAIELCGENELIPATKAYICLGLIYAHLQDFEEGEYHVQNALSILEKIEDQMTKIMVLVNLSLFYTLSGKFDKSIKTCNTVLELLEETNHHYLKATVFSSMGAIYCKTDENKLAIQYLTKAAKLYEESGNSKDVKEIQVNLASVIWKEGNRAEGEKMLLQWVNKENQQLNIETTITAYSFLAERYENDENYEQSLKYYKKWEEVGRVKRKAELESKFEATQMHRKWEAEKKENQRLKEINNQLESFASIISHDLKAPLRTVSGFLDVIEKIESNQLSDKGMGLLQTASDSAKRMDTLIDDLLLYSRTAGRSVKLEQIDLNETLEIVKQNITALTLEKKAEIFVCSLPVINGNQSLLIQLFQNLISNAIKFTPVERNPKIEISVENNDESILMLSVKDNGFGIEKKYFEKVFHVFRRLENSKNVEGSGVGLSICKKIMDKHKGKISIDSELGSGTTFYLRFPNSLS